MDEIPFFLRQSVDLFPFCLPLSPHPGVYPPVDDSCKPKANLFVSLPIFAATPPKEPYDKVQPSQFFLV